MHFCWPGRTKPSSPTSGNRPPCQWGSFTCSRNFLSVTSSRERCSACARTMMMVMMKTAALYLWMWIIHSTRASSKWWCNSVNINYHITAPITRGWWDTSWMEDACLVGIWYTADRRSSAFSARYRNPACQWRVYCNNLDFMVSDNKLIAHRVRWGSPCYNLWW